MESVNNLPEVFGNWQVAPSYPSVEVAFDLGESTAEDASLWRLDLPSDPEAAGAQLEQSAAQVAATQAALEHIPDRIDALLMQRQALDSGQVAFDMAGAAPLAEPESELLRWLDSVDPGQEVSFGLESVTSSAVKGVGAQFLQGVPSLCLVTLLSQSLGALNLSIHQFRVYLEGIEHLLLFGHGVLVYANDSLPLAVYGCLILL